MSTRTYHFERALFVVGAQNSGKSVQLRSMFGDLRFGQRGRIPTGGRVADVYSLSNERWLHLRLTSPHERWECILGANGTNFLDKTEERIMGHLRWGRRWNFACPLQPDASRNMPDVTKTIEAFAQRFQPERIRVAFLSPDRHGGTHQEGQLQAAADLQQIDCEVCWIDARNRTANGLLLADFFDFT